MISNDTQTKQQAWIYDQDTCAFSALGDAQSEFRTLDLFQQADRGYGERQGKAIHVNLPSKNDEELVITKDKSRKLRVFVVPNSHNDPGWHKTVDGYFDDQTHPMLNAMVDKLVKYPLMKFVWAESVFLDLWWKDLDPKLRQTTLDLIARGQLEIVVGSWVVPDEANPTYYAFIDQMIHGHQWLEHHLGVRPNNTWSLDPFGYTSSLAQLYQSAGYDHMLILRVHKDVKALLEDQQALEFRWRQHWDLAGNTDILTHMMPYKLYNIKHTCGPDQYVCLQFDFRRIPGEQSESRAETIHAGNVERQAKKLLGQYYKKAKLFRHNVVLVPLGDDFRYDRPIEWDQQFKNYQMLFNHMNAQPDWNVQAQFGTLQDYFDAVHEEMKLQDFPVLTGDFFPYTDVDGDFWTGYFTTRPWDKVMGRTLEYYVRAADMLHGYALMSASGSGKPYPLVEQSARALDDAHRSLGLFQHHDAVTGTERSYVAMDYRQRLLRAVTGAKKVIETASSFLLSPPAPFHPLTIHLGESFSMSHVAADHHIISPTEGGTPVVLWNTLTQRRVYAVRVYVNTDRVAVFTIEGHVVPSQLEPVWTSTTDISSDMFVLLFLLDLPPLTPATVMVRYVKEPASFKNIAAKLTVYNTEAYHIALKSRFSVQPPAPSMIVLENPVYRARFSQHLGFLHSISTKKPILTNKINLQFLMYRSRGSGAYIFYPTGPAVDTELSNRPVVRVLEGPLSSSVTSLQTTVTHTTTLYNTSSPLGAGLEITNVVDIREMDDKELVMRLSTDVGEDHDYFFTDLNSLSMRRRQHFAHYPPQANYYPLNSVAYLEDVTTRLSLISAQPHGVANLKPGQLEVMLDRRLTYDDGRGLGEGVQDNKITPSRFLLLIEHTTERGAETTKQETSHPSQLAHTLISELNTPALHLHPTNATRPPLPPFPVSELPCDVRLVSLRPLESPASTRDRIVALVLHRVAGNCSFFKPVPLNCKPNASNMTLASILPNVKVKQVKEMTLSLMHEKREVKINDVVHLKPLDFIAFKVFF